MSDPVTPTPVFGVGTVTCPVSCGGNLVSYNENDYDGSTAEARDDEGTIKDITEFGRGSVKVHEATYELACGASLSSFTLGGSGGVERVSVTTNNQDLPQVQIRWYTGLPQCDAGKSFAVSCAVQGKIKAQHFLLGVTGYQQSGTWTASCQFTMKNDGTGAPAVYGFHGATIEETCETIGGAVSQGTADTFREDETRSNSDYIKHSGTGRKAIDPVVASGTSS